MPKEQIGNIKGPAGASAYQLAVAEGFVGSMQDFLDSLVGDPGQNGSDGDDGASAYQVAVDNGFEGTEEEWLESLKGPKGDKGDPGTGGGSGDGPPFEMDNEEWHLTLVTQEDEWSKKEWTTQGGGALTLESRDKDADPDDPPLIDAWNIGLHDNSLLRIRQGIDQGSGEREFRVNLSSGETLKFNHYGVEVGENEDGGGSGQTYPWSEIGSMAPKNIESVYDDDLQEWVEAPASHHPQEFRIRQNDLDRVLVFSKPSWDSDLEARTYEWVEVLSVDGGVLPGIIIDGNALTIARDEAGERELTIRDSDGRLRWVGPNGTVWRLADDQITIYGPNDDGSVRLQHLPDYDLTVQADQVEIYYSGGNARTFLWPTTEGVNTLALLADISWGNLAGAISEQADLQTALNDLSDSVTVVNNKLLPEGTTGNFAAVAGADGSVGDSGFKAEDFVEISSGIMIVEHGSDTSIERPEFVPVVHWSGSVFPANAIIGDLLRITTTNNLHEKTISGWRVISLPEPGSSGKVLISNGSAWVSGDFPESGPTAWGNVTGELSDQTDLATVLDGLNDAIVSVNSKLQPEGTTDNFVSVSGADGSVKDSGYKASDFVASSEVSVVGLSGSYDDLTDKPSIPNPENFATSAQGVLADSAIQPGDLAEVATSGAYSDLTGKPSIPNPADFATSAQGVLAEGAIPSAEKAAAGGVATLDGSQKIPTNQLPDLAVTDFLGEVVNEAAMLALTGQKGDWCIRLDSGTTWVISGTTPSLIGSWRQLSYPAAPVTSVAGKSGVVTLSKSDVGLGSVDNTADSAKPLSGPQSSALTTGLSGRMPQSLSGDPGRFRGVYATAPETLPDPQTGDWIIVLTRTP